MCKIYMFEKLSIVTVLECVKETVLECVNVTVLECINITVLECVDIAFLECVNETVIECVRVTALECSKVSSLECVKAAVLECANVAVLECLKVTVLECKNLLKGYKDFLYFVLVQFFCNAVFPFLLCFFMIDYSMTLFLRNILFVVMFYQNVCVMSGFVIQCSVMQCHSVISVDMVMKNHYA